MDILYDWLRLLQRVVGLSHGTAYEPIHCKWVDHNLEKHEVTWADYDSFCRDYMHYPV